MDMQSVVELVSNIGYPFAITLIMAWYIYYSEKNHREEVNKLSEVVQNNNVVLEKILTKLGEDEEHG